MLKYSVIMVLKENDEDFHQYVQTLYEIFSARRETFEILIIANGVGRFLRKQLNKLNDTNDKIRAYSLNRRVSRAVCLQAGFKESSGEIIVVCGSYQQLATNSLIQMLDSMRDGVDIISPWRVNRVDSLINRFRSKMFNSLVRKVTNSNLHDLNCTVKIFRREVLENVELYGNMYRYIPILAEQKGFKTKEIRCAHYQERPAKTSSHALGEFTTRVIDIFTLYFNTRFSRKPLRFFSALGLIFLLTGLSMNIYIFAEKFFLGHSIGDRPMLLLAVLLMVLGVQAASVGLLGEIIAFTHGRHSKEYTVEKII
jgi:hypothetical protein